MCFSCLELLFAVVVGLFFTQREEKKIQADQKHITANHPRTFTLITGSMKHKEEAPVIWTYVRETARLVFGQIRDNDLSDTPDGNTPAERRMLFVKTSARCYYMCSYAAKAH